MNRQLQTLANKLAPYLLPILLKLFTDSGTWSPVLQGSGVAGTFAYDTSNTGGEYTRLGNRVLFHGRIRITAITVNPTLNLTITGLPITSASPSFGRAGDGAFGTWQGFTLPAGYTQVGLIVGVGGTSITIQRMGSAVAQATMQGADFALVGGVANFDFYGEYRV